MSVFGCGYVHDAMPRAGVGQSPITTVLVKPTSSIAKEVIATFGKSTYREPFLSMSAVHGMSLAKNAIPDM